MYIIFSVEVPAIHQDFWEHSWKEDFLGSTAKMKLPLPRIIRGTPSN